jgi:DNA-binding NtrC family response regulator
LIVDDDPIVADSLAQTLRADGHETATAHDGGEALSLLDEVHRRFHVLITDLNLPREGGMSLLKQVRQDHADIVPIVMTGFGKVESAVASMKLGAADYLTKPILEDQLRRAVSQAAHRQALLAENDTLRDQLAQRFGLEALVGADPRMQQLFDLVQTVAASKTTVLITGETGTGKSLVARALHTLSPRGVDRRQDRGTRPGKKPDRRQRRSGLCGPFVTLTCGAVPETLLESELFGHVRGAFPGAEADQHGKLRAAEGGTLLIDDVQLAPPALQLKLLRLLQEQSFEPVGSTQTHHADVRFVFAAGPDLKQRLEAGHFREDLHHRINVVRLDLPPLRDRPGDLPRLAEHFLHRSTDRAESPRPRKLSAAALEALGRYGWPGNVRELENAIERAVVVSRGPTIEPGDLPEAIRTSGPPVTGSASGGGGGGVIPALADGWTPTPLAEALQAPERQILLAALEANGWNRQATSRQLDINRTTLYKKIKQYRLDEPGSG